VDLPANDNPARSFRFANARMEGLVHELIDRAARILDVSDRTRGLLEAVVAIGSDLSLPDVLRRIIDSAATLVSARYGALGVIGPDGRLTDFITVGLSPDEVEAIGAHPEGHGLLGAVISARAPIRVEDITSDGRASGFPAHHPPMRSFLGVPIRVGTEVFGDLYVCDKTLPSSDPGVADGSFDADDEELLVAFAAAAGIAIENARLYQRVREREQTAAGIQEVTEAILRDAPQDTITEIVARRTRLLVGTELSVVMRRDAARPVLHLYADGSRAADVTGTQLAATAEQDVLMARDASDATVLDAASAGCPVADLADLAHLGPMLIVPMQVEDRPGLVVLGNHRGGPAVTAEQRERAVHFATQVRVALALRGAQTELRRLSVLHDRERIAADLHDKVIQRLFAAGMSLQSVEPLVGDPTALQRVRTTIDTLDETIREIRTTIFDLSPPAAQRSLRALVTRLCDDYADRFGFTCRASFDGDVDGPDVVVLAEHVVATLREALSNVARHAEAGTAEVRLELVGDELTLEVRDDGVGVPAGVARRSGLGTMARRAEELGGTFSISPGPVNGTVVLWRIPVAG
jgi:signal transduction histidine kinase